MKLIIQIPCYNEERTLPVTLGDLPSRIEGIDSIEIQVIDDGSTDKTYSVAKELGVTHIVQFKQNKGLAAAFKAGVDSALANDADILVNTDADNQYCGRDIAKLVDPIIEGRSDIVIGCRQIDDHPEFSFIKKKLQKIGSWVLRKVSNTNVEDATSGFRAYNKESMLHINIFSNFSYCMETLIQAGYNNLKVSSVNININPKTRRSRLYKNVIHYIWESGKTIVNIFLLYRSSRFFGYISAILFLSSIILVIRYLIIVLPERHLAEKYWPTLNLSGILLLLSFFIYLTGLITSLIAANRKLSEELLFKLKKWEIDKQEGNELEKSE